MMQGMDVHDRRTLEMHENLDRINQQNAAMQQQMDATERYIWETWAMASNAQNEAHEYYKYQGFYDPDA